MLMSRKKKEVDGEIGAAVRGDITQGIRDGGKKFGM